jgi:RNA polymerase sigma-70 factor (ECF subfamily)
LSPQEKAREAEEDRALVDRARAGDKAAFTRLMEKYQTRVYAVAVGMLRSRDDALDVVQDAFVKVHAYLDRFQGQSSFYTWLYRITVNLCIDARRRHARSRTEPMEDSFQPDADRASELAVSPVRPGGQPLRDLANRELGQQISLALSRLTPNHRAILLLREVEGLSYEDLAQVLGISKGTVMSRLFHARQNMQKMLRPVLGLPDGAGLGGQREGPGASRPADLRE